MRAPRGAVGPEAKEPKSNFEGLYQRRTLTSGVVRQTSQFVYQVRRAKVGGSSKCARWKGKGIATVEEGTSMSEGKNKKERIPGGYDSVYMDTLKTGECRGWMGQRRTHAPHARNAQSTTTLGPAYCQDVSHTHRTHTHARVLARIANAKRWRARQLRRTPASWQLACPPRARRTAHGRDGLRANRACGT